MTSMSNFIHSKSDSGSPAQGGPEFLVVGKIRRPHGLRGDLLMTVWTDFPERLQPGFELFVGEDHQLLKLRSVRWHGADMLVAFDGYWDRDQAGHLRNQLVSVRAATIPELEEGEYYLHELVGLRVLRDDNGGFLGVVEKIIETGAAHDVFLVITDDDREILLPDIEAVVVNIDVDRNEMRVNLIDGLLPEDWF